MVKIEYTNNFKKNFSKIRDKEFKKRIVNQIEKIIDNPNIGKPMRNIRKGTREVYISPYRLAYNYNEKEIILIFIEIYPESKQ